ncbi:MAG: helix-turn-helix domain-containing protein [Polyangiaceae bacterium]
MVQRPKAEVRARLVAAAREVFSEQGFSGATMAGVAERAQVSTGNVYRYFSSKEALLEEVLPASFAKELRRLVRSRVDALAAVRDIALLPDSAPYFAASARLFEFCIEHRERVVFLLSGSKATVYESFAAELARDLEQWSLRYARRAYPQLRPSAALRFALSEIFANYVASLSRALSSNAERGALEDAVAHLSAYHLGGMKQLFEAALLPAEQRRRRPIGGRK